MVILEGRQYIPHFSNSSSWAGVIALVSTLLAPGSLFQMKAPRLQKARMHQIR